MRAVLVFPAAPLPFGDTAARWFHLLARDLLARGASVSCLTVSDEPRERVEEARARLTPDLLDVLDRFAARFGKREAA